MFIGQQNKRKATLLNKVQLMLFIVQRIWTEMVLGPGRNPLVNGKEGAKCEPWLFYSPCFALSAFPTGFLAAPSSTFKTRDQA